MTGVASASLLVDRSPSLTMVLCVILQTVALAVQYVNGASRSTAIATIAASGLAIAAFSSVLGARVLVVAPGSSDFAASGTSTAFKVGNRGRICDRRWSPACCRGAEHSVDRCAGQRCCTVDTARRIRRLLDESSSGNRKRAWHAPTGTRSKPATTRR